MPDNPEERAFSSYENYPLSSTNSSQPNNYEDSSSQFESYNYDDVAVSSGNMVSSSESYDYGSSQPPIESYDYGSSQPPADNSYDYGSSQPPADNSYDYGSSQPSANDSYDYDNNLASDYYDEVSEDVDICDPSVESCSVIVPESCVDGSEEADIDDLGESQMEEDDLYVNICFCVSSKDDLKEKNGGCRNEENPNLYDHLHTFQNIDYEAGEYDEDLDKLYQYNGDEDHDRKIKYIFINCDDLYVDQTCRVCDANQMGEKLLKAARELSLFFQSNQATINNVHFVITGFTPLEALVVAMARLLDYELDGVDELEFADPDEHEVVSDFALNNLSDYFNYFEELGWTYEVDYACIYEGFFFEMKQYAHDPGYYRTQNRKGRPRWDLGDGKKYSIKEMEEGLGRPLTDREKARLNEGKNEDVLNANINITISFSDGSQTLNSQDFQFTRCELEDYLGRDLTDSEVYYINEGKYQDVEGLEEALSTYAAERIGFIAAHLGLGIASIFFSPIALVDIGLEVWEMARYGEWDDPWHWISIGVNVVALIPVLGGIGKTIYEGISGTARTAKVVTQTSKTGKALKATDEVIQAGTKGGKAAKTTSEGSKAVKETITQTIKKHKPKKTKNSSGRRRGKAKREAQAKNRNAQEAKKAKKQQAQQNAEVESFWGQFYTKPADRWKQVRHPIDTIKNDWKETKEIFATGTRYEKFMNGWSYTGYATTGYFVYSSGKGVVQIVTDYAPNVN